MTTTNTPNLSLVKSVTGTNEPWSNDTLNGNWDKIDAAVGARTSKFTTTTVSNTAGEQSLFSVPILANQPQGSSYRMVLWGTYDNSGTATNYVIRVKIGGTTITSITITTPASAQTNQAWKVEFELTIVTTGPTGTWDAVLTWGSLPAAGAFNAVVVPAVVTTRDTTGINNMEITVQWAAANASNTLRARAGYYNRMV